jgi:hypothetical protein
MSVYSGSLHGVAAGCHAQKEAAGRLTAKVKGKMNTDDLKKYWLEEFRSGSAIAIDIPKEQFRLCFPDDRSTAAFIKTAGLDLHITENDLRETFTLSVDDPDPWG